MRTIPVSRALAVGSLLLVVGGSLWTFVPGHAAQRVSRESFTMFPMKLGEWTGLRNELEDSTVMVLAADEYLLADYRSPAKIAAVNLFVAYYFSTSDGTGIHSPEICIPGSGWEVFRWEEIHVAPGHSIQPFNVNRAVIQKGQNRQLVYYWFEQRGRRLTGEMETKLYTVYDSTVYGRADGALVRLTTPLGLNEAEQEGDRRLQEFMVPVLKALPAYIPG